MSLIKKIYNHHNNFSCTLSGLLLIIKGDAHKFISFFEQNRESERYNAVERGIIVLILERVNIIMYYYRKIGK